MPAASEWGAVRVPSQQEERRVEVRIEIKFEELSFTYDAPFPTSFGPMSDDSERQRVGLCFECRQARRITSDRGSVFYLCERSKTDSRFVPYPLLPVLACAGFERAPASGALFPNSTR